MNCNLNRWDTCFGICGGIKYHWPSIVTRSRGPERKLKPLQMEQMVSLSNQAFNHKWKPCEHFSPVINDLLVVLNISGAKLTILLTVDRVVSMSFHDILKSAHLLYILCWISSRLNRSQPSLRWPAPARGRRTLKPDASLQPALLKGKGTSDIQILWIWWVNNHSTKPFCVDCLLFKLTYLIETSYKSFSLLHNAPLHPPSRHTLNVFLLVLLCHLDVGASRLQLPLCHLSNDVKEF